MLKRLTAQISFRVSGRGELHLSILIENMRREGLRVSRISSRSNHERRLMVEILEPFETVTIDVMEEHQGGIMEKHWYYVRVSMKDMSARW